MKIKRIIAGLILAMMISPLAWAVTNSAVNLAITNNSDGFDVTGGTTTRKLIVTGAGWTLGATTFVAGANTFTLPGTSATLARTDAANTFTGHQTIEGVTSTGATGTGNFVFSSSPTLVTPVLGTPTSVTLNNTSDVIGGVTMTLGSDATADMYYRNSSGVLSRLGLSSANLLVGYDSTDAIPAAITIGSGLTYTHSTHTLSASASGFSPMPMTVITGTSQSASSNNAYISNNAGLVTITLPSSASVGDQIIVGGLGAGGWKIAQNASQLIHFGNAVTTTGTGGSLASTNQYDSVTITCVVTNTTWIVIGSQGNITIV